MPKKNEILIIVDVQNGFVNDVTRHIPNAVEKLQEKYEHIYASQFVNMPNSPFRKILKWNRFYPASNDIGLAFEVSPKANVFQKEIYSCINCLESPIIINENYKYHIVGIDTDICVTKTAVDLFERGCHAVVLSEYCASHAGYQAHENALEILGRYIGRHNII